MPTTAAGELRRGADHSRTVRAGGGLESQLTRSAAPSTPPFGDRRAAITRALEANRPGVNKTGSSEIDPGVCAELEQHLETWVSVSGTAGEDLVAQLAADRAGRIYAAGTEGTDTFVRGYAADGTVLLDARWPSDAGTVVSGLARGRTAAWS